METSTAFILNDAIQSWRDGLSRSPNFREEDLAELEAHLRDSVAAFQARGLTPEEAFLLAARRLGHPAGLEPEFAKINRREVWLNRLLWMLVGIQAWSLLNTLSHLATDATVLGSLAGLGYHFASSAPGAHVSWTEVSVGTAIYTLVNLGVLAGGVAACWRLSGRMENKAGRLTARALRRPIVAGIGIIACLVIVNLSLTAESMWLHRYYPAGAVATIAVSRSLAGTALGLLQMLVLLVATILLLRRRFRLSRAA